MDDKACKKRLILGSFFFFFFPFAGVFSRRIQRSPGDHSRLSWAGTVDPAVHREQNQEQHVVILWPAKGWLLKIFLSRSTLKRWLSFWTRFPINQSVEGQRLTKAGISVPEPAQDGFLIGISMLGPAQDGILTDISVLEPAQDATHVFLFFVFLFFVVGFCLFFHHHLGSKNPA